MAKNKTARYRAKKKSRVFRKKRKSRHGKHL